MRFTRFLVSIGLVSALPAFAYDISLSDGTVGTDYVNFSSIFGARHWDSFGLEWSPANGESAGLLSGSSQSLGTKIEVQSEVPEQIGQSISLLLDCQVEESQALTFQNYQDIPFDIHYGFQITVWADPSKTGAYLARYNLAPNQSDVLLSLTVGSSVWMEFFVDASSIHDAHDNYQTIWHPAVLNASSAAHVSVDVSGTLKPLSIQVVPEPTAGSLGLVAGVTALVLARERRAQGGKLC